MVSISEELKKNMYNQIRGALSSELKILFISLTGSQGKNMASAESDYDVRVIVQNTFQSYILQRPKQTIQVKTELDGRELEGQAVDIIKAFDYSLETNAFMLDLLRGIPIFCESKELIEQLRVTFLQGFLPIVPLNAFQGILYHYLSRELKEKGAKGEKPEDRKLLAEAPVKAVVECIFVALEIRCVLAGKNISEYFDIDKLMEFAGEDEGFMKPLIELRRTDRKQKVPVTEEFIKTIEKTLALVDEYKGQFSKEKKQVVNDTRAAMREEVDRTCLELICKSREATQ